jgi:hypothetical protein
MKKLMTTLLSLIVIMLVFSCQIFNGPDTVDHVYPPGAKLHLVKQYTNNGIKLLGVSEEYIYDNAGRISRVENPLATYMMYGIFSDSYQEYSYSDDGLLLSIAYYEVSYFDSGSLNNTQNIFYQYDNQGKMLREDFDYPEEPDKWGYNLYEYDDSKLTKKMIYSSNIYDYYNDSLCYLYTYTYDDSDMLEAMRYFSTDSSLLRITDYTYEDGLKTKETVTDTLDQIRSERYYFYDINRNMIKEVYEDEFTVYVYKYEYYEE